VDVAPQQPDDQRSLALRARGRGEVGVRRAEFFPFIEIDGSITRQKTRPSAGSSFLQTTYGPPRR
jgi:hypothetical protein